MIPVSGRKRELWQLKSGVDPKVFEEEIEDNKPNWRDRVREIVTPIWFDYHGTHFFDGDGKMIAQIRGWGGLTSSGLSNEEARGIQEKNAAYIVAAVNEYENLKEMLRSIRDMPEYDQDDAHRLRNIAKVGLESIGEMK